MVNDMTRMRDVLETERWRYGGMVVRFCGVLGIGKLLDGLRKCMDALLQTRFDHVDYVVCAGQKIQLSIVVRSQDHTRPKSAYRGVWWYIH
jgi:hypothetical protein